MVKTVKNFFEDMFSNDSEFLQGSRDRQEEVKEFTPLITDNKLKDMTMTRQDRIKEIYAKRGVSGLGAKIAFLTTLDEDILAQLASNLGLLFPRENYNNAALAVLGAEGVPEDEARVIITMAREVCNNTDISALADGVLEKGDKEMLEGVENLAFLSSIIANLGDNEEKANVLWLAFSALLLTSSNPTYSNIVVDTIIEDMSSEQFENLCKNSEDFVENANK